MSITAGKLPLTLLLMLVIVSAGSLVQLQPVSATFPGANGKIVFARNIGTVVDQTKSAKNIATQTYAPAQATIQWEIFTVNPDGSGLTQLTFTGPGARNEYPRWSADGTMIVFNRGGGFPNIWVMNADGSGQTQITHSTVDINHHPAFSPDGSRIVFVSNRPPSATDNIWVMNADGSHLQQLTAITIGGDEDPVWSPDGSKIAFTRYGTPKPHIFVMNPDGSSQTDISIDPSFSDTLPEWSPDGRMIAFQSDRGSGFQRTIWVMNADGSNKNQLSHPPAGLIEDTFPAWSPDGTKIAFARSPITGSIIVMNADGSNPTDITQSQPNSGSDAETNWQPLPARPVGGVVLPTNKLEILTPYLTLAGLAAALSAVVVVKRRRA